MVRNTKPKNETLTEAIESLCDKSVESFEFQVGTINKDADGKFVVLGLMTKGTITTGNVVTVSHRKEDIIRLVVVGIKKNGNVCSIAEKDDVIELVFTSSWAGIISSGDLMHE